jgi:NADPH:quinone reductase-like Zn-dependent oxidoreductase
LPRFDQGVIVPVIDQVYPVNEVVAAHQRMESNANAGKIILTMDW